MKFSHSGLIVLLTSVALLDVPAANAQLVDSVRSVFVTDANAGSTFTMYELVGFHTFPGEEVGAFLGENGFRNNLAGDNIAGGRLALGFEMFGDINHWLIGMGFRFGLPIFDLAPPSADVSMTMFGVQLGTGYQLLRAGKFRLHPLLGLGLQASTLTINQGDDDSFQGLFADTSARNFVFNNTEVHVTAGLGFEYEWFTLHDDESHSSNITIGARSEYDFGLWETWSRPGSAGTLRGGPDMALRGFNFWLTVGLKLRQKVYDARIIAERQPESDEDEGE